mgnify:CR=1 FL=1
MNKKTMNRLTEVQVDKVKPLEESYKISDGGGMYLLVHHNISTYWRINYQINGQQHLVIDTSLSPPQNANASSSAMPGSTQNNNASTGLNNSLSACFSNS